MAPKRVGITARALIQRVNRHLQDEGKVLKRPRTARLIAELGDYYILDEGRAAVVKTHVDLEEFGRKLGVLQAFEQLEKEDE